MIKNTVGIHAFERYLDSIGTKHCQTLWDLIELIEEATEKLHEGKDHHIWSEIYRCRIGISIDLHHECIEEKKKNDQEFKPRHTYMSCLADCCKL